MEEGEDGAGGEVGRVEAGVGETEVEVRQDVRSGLS